MTKRFLLAGVLAFTALVYLNSLHGEFVFDDLAVIQAHTSGMNPEMARQFGISHRPVTWWTYGLDYYWAGVQPFYFHLSNLLIHLISVSLVFAILTTRYWLTDKGAAFGALVFGIHPFFSSAVDYIDARGSMLAAMFVLAACAVALRFTSKWRWLAVAGLFALGVASKEEALVFIALVAGYAVVRQEWRTAAVAFGLMAVGFLAIVVMVPYVGTPFNTSIIQPVESMVINGGFNAVDLLDHLQITLNGYVFHTLGNLIAPFGLSADPLPHYGDKLWIVSVFVIVGMAAFVLLGRKGMRQWRYGVAALLCAPILGCLGVLVVEPLFEYRNYILGLGVAILAGSFYEWAAPRMKGFRPAAFILVFALAFGTIQRNEVWRTVVGVWTDAANKAPNKVRPAQNLSAQLIQLSRYAEARPILEHILAVDPGARGLHVNMASLCIAFQQWKEAEYHARRGVPISQAYTFLAMAQMQQIQPELALPNIDKALALEPKFAFSWMVKSDILTMMGRNAEALLAQAEIARIQGAPQPKGN